MQLEMDELLNKGNFKTVFKSDKQFEASVQEEQFELSIKYREKTGVGLMAIIVSGGHQNI